MIKMRKLLIFQMLFRRSYYWSSPSGSSISPTVNSSNSASSILF